MPEPTASQSANKESPQETSENAGKAADDKGSKATPEGIVPLFFSGKSQEIFECVADTDLTPENPHKLIVKEKIVQDLKNRAAVSDFFPVKQKVLNYPGDELLLVYDYDFRFGENFYICLTEEAKDWILNPPEDEVCDHEGIDGKEDEDEKEEMIPPTPVPKEWDCLGSDLEIKEGFMEPGRPLLHFKISRKRRHFGSLCVFSDYMATDHPEAYAEVAPQQNPNFELKRLENDVAVQAVMDHTDATSQTEWRQPCSAAVQYSARSMSDEEAHSVWQGSALKEFLGHVCPRLEVYLQQNSILDLFTDDYKALSDTDGITGNKSDTNLKEYQSFTDLRFSKDKVITWIDWHPTIKGIIAVSCGDSYSFNERIDLSFIQSNFLILIWNFVDPIHPQLFLEAPDTVRCFQFNPSNPNVIVGGCSNGQIVLWNIEDYQDRLQLSKATDPVEPRSMAANLAIFDTDPKLDHAPIVLYCASSAIKEGHSMSVSDVQWIPNQIQLCQKTAKVLENQSQKCNQIISSSIDGSVLFWDIHPPVQKKANETNKPKATVASDQPFSYLDLTWKPFLKIPLPRSQFPGNFAVTRISIKEKIERIKNKPSVSERASEGGLDESSTTDKVIEDASTKFFVGTEDGEIVYSDWVPTKDSESGKLIASPPESSFRVHCGAVSCLERSPFFRDVLLSVGGWNFALWKEGAKSDALFKSCSSTVPLTGGAWSPTRPGVFFITKQNGNVDVWDLLDRSHEPLLAQNISTMSITFIHPWQLTSKQQVLAVGDSSGTLHILEVPWSLSHSSSNEEPIMKAFFDCEVQRLEFTTLRMDKRAKEKKAIDTAKAEAIATEDKKTEIMSTGESWEEKMKKEYDDYLTMEVKMLIKLGIIQPESEPDN